MNPNQAVGGAEERQAEVVEDPSLTQGGHWPREVPGSDLVDYIAVGRMSAVTTCLASRSMICR